MHRPAGTWVGSNQTGPKPSFCVVSIYLKYKTDFKERGNMVFNFHPRCQSRTACIDILWSLKHPWRSDGDMFLATTWPFNITVISWFQGEQRHWLIMIFCGKPDNKPTIQGWFIKRIYDEFWQFVRNNVVCYSWLGVPPSWNFKKDICLLGINDGRHRFQRCRNCTWIALNDFWQIVFLMFISMFGIVP